MDEVTLSADIRNWVLIPLTLASLLMDILTQLAQRVRGQNLTCHASRYIRIELLSWRRLGLWLSWPVHCCIRKPNMDAVEQKGCWGWARIRGDKADEGDKGVEEKKREQDSNKQGRYLELVPSVICLGSAWAAVSNPEAALFPQAFTSAPSNQAKDKSEIREAQAYIRSMRLMQQGSVIPAEGFRVRKAYFLDEKTGLFKQDVQRKSSQEQMMENPNMMTDMMKKNVSGMLPQVRQPHQPTHRPPGCSLGETHRAVIQANRPGRRGWPDPVSTSPTSRSSCGTSCPTSSLALSWAASRSLSASASEACCSAG